MLVGEGYGPEKRMAGGFKNTRSCYVYKNDAARLGELICRSEWNYWTEQWTTGSEKWHSGGCYIPQLQKNSIRES